MKKFLFLVIASLFAVSTSAMGGMVPTKASEVARPGGKLPGNPKIVMVKVADGFNDPINVQNAGDGSGRLFVVERVGRIKIIKNGKLLPKPFLDLTAINPLGSIVLTQFVEQGLYGVAFHPNYKKNGYFYVHYASLPFNGDGMIVRFSVSKKNKNRADPKTAKVIMRIPQPWYNHNGGEIEFGPDGYLYISSGDGGWEGDPYEAGQDLSTWLGKMLRVDVNTTDGSPYKIPKSNPYANASSERLMELFGITEEGFSKIKTRSRPEIWAYGIRNSWQFSFDQKTGDLFMAEVGQNHLEEINYQPASSKGGENYGWPIVMGTQCHPISLKDNCPKVGVLPAAEYPHDTGGCAVMGFGVANNSGMKGVYVVGDWCTGRVWGLGQNRGKWQLQQLLHTSLQFTGGGVDEAGNIYAVNCGDCFYTRDKGAMKNPKGALWRVYAANKAPKGAMLAPVAK